MAALIRHSNERPEPLNVIGTEITILAARGDTNNMEVTLQRGDEGTGPPPHSHAWDESFFILDGAVSFTCEGETSVCEKGALVCVPAGTVHSFQYCEGGGEMLEFTGQGSMAAQMFNNVASEVPPGPLDPEHVVDVFNRNGVTVHV